MHWNQLACDTPSAFRAVNHYVVPENCCEDLQLESLQVLVLTSYKVLLFWECKGQWHQESAPPTQPMGRWVKTTFLVYSFYKNQVFVCLIRGENYWPPVADLALCQSFCLFPTAPEAVNLVMLAQRVINNVLAIHWFVQPRHGEHHHRQRWGLLWEQNHCFQPITLSRETHMFFKL